MSFKVGSSRKAGFAARLGRALPERSPQARGETDRIHLTLLLTGARTFILGLMSDITPILSAMEQGDPSAAAQFLSLVYAELRKPGAEKMANERPGQTLEATALGHWWLNCRPCLFLATV